MLLQAKPSTIAHSLLLSTMVIGLTACSSTTSTPLTETKPHQISPAVVYQTESKEYPLLSSFVYQRAIAALPQAFKEGDVVVMDVDETVLDNSQYQRERESQGLGYSSQSWNEWVMRKEATLVPGAAAFLNEVVERNGKVALITNRNKNLDSYTWDNLLAQGLPLTPDNTCIIGRVAADKEAVGQEGMINDKDRRRAHLSNGTAICSINSDTAQWAKPHNIIMQIGDNIEDFAGVTQESAEVDALLPQVGVSLFILPNPMYGSW